MGDDGAESGFRDYVAGRWPHLVRTAYLVTGDLATAEDLAQQAFVQLYRYWPRVVAAGSPDPYVRRIVLNLATRRWRLRRREQLLPDLPEVPAAGDAFAAADGRDEMAQALARLPRRMRAVLVLRYYEQLTERETAEALNCAVGTVKSQTARALDRLRGVLAADREQPREAPAALRAARGHHD